MPIELCSELTPKILLFTEIEDSTVKTQAYLAVEVLFASRRFQDQQLQAIGMTPTKALRHLLDNAEIIQNMSVEQAGEDEEDE